jgi:hypothetical protein|tara:strand:- start:606 stop:1157 length:552 start_codon:yes stop_codon:yes gene_type:complete
MLGPSSQNLGYDAAFGGNMIRRIAALPIRVLKRALNAIDGERNAPSPAPPMPTMVEPKTASAPSVSPTEKPAPKKTTKKKPATATAKATKAAPKRSKVQVDPQETPNPNAMKFTLNQTVAETGSFSFNSGDENIAHPIAAAVVKLEGVVSVFGVKDFITVSKADASDWQVLLPMVVDAIKGAA